MISSKLLRTFCVLVETKNFTRAAETLCITQSGVSQQIKKLEQLLGEVLIDRSDKSFRLTDTGIQTYEEAKKVIDLLEGFPEKIKSDSEYEGTIRVMSPGSVGLRLYPELLLLQKAHSRLAISYKFGPNQNIATAIKDRSIDIGLMTDLPNNYICESKALTSEKLLLVTSNDFGEPTLTNLNALGFINHPDGHYHATLLLSKNFTDFNGINLIPESGFSNQISLILEPVMMGLGFTVLPESAVYSYVHRDKLKIHSLAEEVFEPIYLVYKRGGGIPKRVLYVITQIEAILENAF